VIWVYDFQDKKARPLLVEDSKQIGAVLSPDGRWLAYTSRESGAQQIYVRSFPGLDRKWLVSTQGGDHAHWRKDSKELWYAEPGPDGQRIMSVAVAVENGTLKTSVPLKPSRCRDPSSRSPDGHTRFLALRATRRKPPARCASLTESERTDDGHTLKNPRGNGVHGLYRRSRMNESGSWRLPDRGGVLGLAYRSFIIPRNP
jgi:hypothetical protein